MSDNEQDRKKTAVVLAARLEPPAVPGRWAPKPPAPPVKSSGTVTGWLEVREITVRYSSEIQRDIAEIRAQVEAFEAYTDLCFAELKASTQRFQSKAEVTRAHFDRIMSSVDRVRDDVRELKKQGASAEEIATERAELRHLQDWAMKLHLRFMDE